MNNFLCLCALTGWQYPSSQLPAMTIGFVKRDLLEVTPVIQKTSHTECQLTLKFERIRAGKRISLQRFEAGMSFGMPTIITRNLLANGRRQVFLELSRGQTKSYLLDYDGKSIKVLYRNSYGRVDALLSFDESGRPVIVEYWPRLSYEDAFGPGGHPYASGGREGTVRRSVLISSLVGSPEIDGKRLRQNKSKTVNVPGPTPSSSSSVPPSSPAWPRPKLSRSSGRVAYV